MGNQYEKDFFVKCNPPSKLFLTLNSIDLLHFFAFYFSQFSTAG